MADKSAIEWTDATWNPVRARNRKTGKAGWHCEHATTGCEFCYAETFNRRLGTGLPFKPGHRRDIDLFLDEKTLAQPLRWRRPRMIFVCSMTDLFADFVPDAWIDQVFAVMALSPQHTFQVLTKRARRMREYLSAMEGAWHAMDSEFSDRWGTAAAEISGSPCAAGAIEENEWPLPNVWLGVSAERQQEADERVPELLETPAAIRFVSAEPLLGPIDFTSVSAGIADLLTNALTGRFHAGDCPPQMLPDPVTKLDWIIVGGESGQNARPMHPDWARSIRDQCAATRGGERSEQGNGNGTAFFFKQWGQHRPPTENDQIWRSLGKKASGRLLDGVEHNEMPELR